MGATGASGAAISALASESSIEVREERVSVPGGAVDRVCEPRNVGELEAIVRAAGIDREGLLVMGGRTRLHWANRAQALGLGISMSGISGVDEFEPEEGVLHALAGTPVQEIREVAAKEGWELPLDSPGQLSTLGGTIASAAAGPRAHLFGPVKDAVLGLEVVGGDGVATKCGGRVVKNVTGYDMAKLYCGSYGSLAIVTGAWLRLRPAPAKRITLRAGSSNDKERFEAIRALSQLTSVRALIWSSTRAVGKSEITVELGGSAEGVEHDRAKFGECLPFDEIAEDTVDHLREERSRTDSPLALRARVLGTRCHEMMEVVLDAGLRVSADPGTGTIHASGSLPDPSLLALLRERAELAGGFAQIETLPDEWRDTLDVFGSLGGTALIVSTLKRRFDPAGILNPGRFVALGPSADDAQAALQGGLT